MCFYIEGVSLIFFFLPSKYSFTTKIVAVYTFIRIKHMLSFKEYKKERELTIKLWTGRIIK